MPKLRKALFAVLPLLWTTMAVAQSARMPEPELKKLEYFAGNWSTSGSMIPGPLGKGGPVTATSKVAWQKGGFFLLSHGDYKGPTGEGVELSIMGYDPAQKVYTYESFNSDGEHEVATGTVQGDTWVWKSDEPNAPFKWRYTQKTTSPSSFESKFEISQDGSSWMAVFQSRSVKSDSSH